MERLMLRPKTPAEALNRAARQFSIALRAEGLTPSRPPSKRRASGAAGSVPHDGRSSPVSPAANRGAAADPRLLHDDEPGALEVLRQSLGDDRRHHLAGVVRPRAPAVAQREGERICEV